MLILPGSESRIPLAVKSARVWICVWKDQLGESKNHALFPSDDSVSFPGSCAMRTWAMGFHSPAVFISFPLDKAVAIIFSLS